MNIGVTIENNKLSTTTRFILNDLIKENLFKIYLINIEFVSEKKKQSSFIKKYLLFIERLLMFLLKILNLVGFYSFNNKINLISDELIFNSCVKVIDVKQTRKGFHSFTSSKTLQKYDLDFVIRGNGLLIEHGELLNIGHKYGILSLHHSDNRIYRGGPWGFWEVYNNNEMSGITLQKLSHELDGGEVIARANLETKINWTENKNNLDMYSGIVIVKFLKTFINNKSVNFENEIFKKVYINNIFKSPNLYEINFYFLISIQKYFTVLYSNLRKVIFKRVSIKFLQDYWTIYVGDETKRVNKWQWSQNYQKNYWLADPFLISIENTKFLICESFSIKDDVASIVYYKFVNDKVDFSKSYKLISNNKHLSYPFTFQKNNKNYCMPEAGEDGVWIYQLFIEGNKLVAKKDRCILEGNYVDPTLINVEGVDYLFVNPDGPSQPRSLLKIFYSNDILKDKLIEHPNNPVMIDSRYARSAGRIQKINNKIIRPSQNCNKLYGKNIDFSEIMINKNEFSTLSIDSLNGLDSKSQIHHFEFLDSGSNNIIAIDSNYYSIKHK